MQSKTSFFNLALFKKNISRGWVVCLVYFIYLLLMLPLSYLMEMSAYTTTDWSSPFVAQSNLLQRLAASCNGIFPMIFVIMTTIVCFKYLFSKRDSYMIHAFPVSRKSLYFTGLLSILVIMLVPLIVTALITEIVAAVTGAGGYLYIVYWFYNQFAGMIILIGIAMISVMITGQFATSVIFYFVFNFLYIMMEFVIRLFESSLMFGMSNSMSDITVTYMTPSVYMSSGAGISYSLSWDDDYITLIGIDVVITGKLILLAYILVGLVLIGIAYFAYTRKKLETVADFITVPWLKPVFSMGMSFFISVAIGVFVTSMINYGINQHTYSANFATCIVVALIAGIILYYVCAMLIAKTIRVFNLKTLMGCGVYTLVALVVLVCFRFDAFNVENNIPSTDEIKWAGIYADYPMVCTDEDEIDAIREIHQSIVDDKKEIRDFSTKLNDSGASTKYVTIKYVLNNGKTVNRQYILVDPDINFTSGEYENVANEMLDFCNDPEIIKKHVIGAQWDDCTAVEASFPYAYVTDDGYYSLEYGNNGDVTKDELEESANEIYQAVLKDIDNGACLQTVFTYDDSIRIYNDLSITLKANSGSFTDDESIFYGYESYDSQNYQYIVLTTNCTNTLAVLKEYGYYTSDDEIITYEQVYQMNPTYY